MRFVIGAFTLALCAAISSAASASFIGYDETTKGNWYTGPQSNPTFVYGKSGYEIAYYPAASGWTEILGNQIDKSYINMNKSVRSHYSEKIDVINYGAQNGDSYLRNPNEGIQPWTGRYDSVVYGNTITVDFQAASEDMKRVVSFYFKGRSDTNNPQTVEILDYKTGKVLAVNGSWKDPDTNQQVSYFKTGGGIYVKFLVEGSFKARIRTTSFDKSYADLSGFFVDKANDAEPDSCSSNKGVSILIKCTGTGGIWLPYDIRYNWFHKFFIVEKHV